MWLTQLLQIDPNITIPYLILGYVVMTFIALFYVILLFNRQRNLKQDLELMHKLLEDDK